MPVEVNIDVNKVLKSINDITMDFMVRLCEDLVRESQDRVPLDTGNLMASIGFEVGVTNKNIIKGIVFAKNVINQSGTEIPLDLFVHEGVKAHFPPLEPIKKWAERNLGSDEYAYPIAVAIAQRGVQYEVRGKRGKKFYERAYNENKRRYWDMLIQSFLRENYS